MKNILRIMLIIAFSSCLIGCDKKENIETNNKVVGTPIVVTAEPRVEKGDLIDILYSEFKEILNSNKKNIIIVGRDNCPHCMNYKPLAKELATEKNITIYFLNTNTIDNRDELNELFNFLNVNSVPTTIIVSKGEILALEIGNIGKNGLNELLNTNYY